MRVEARRELLAPPEDVSELVAEPYRLPDWWPADAGVEPDRLRLAEGAQWPIGRGSTHAGTSSLLRRLGGASSARILSEGLRSVRTQAVRRLFDLCQTGAELR